MAEPALAKGMAVDDKVKKRLVGAVVLVSLGVIFIPMLLEERTPSGMPTFGSNVPAEPDHKFETLDIPLQLPEPPRTRQTVVETEAEAVELEKAAKAEQAQKEEKPKPPASDTASATTATRKTAARPPATSEPAPEPAPEPASSAGADVPRGWVVQVGSFIKPANAFGLRDRIRSKGFPAFVEQLRTGGQIAYRVRVGPELSRDRAETLKGKLAAGMKLDGLIMSHP